MLGPFAVGLVAASLVYTAIDWWRAPVFDDPRCAVLQAAEELVSRPRQVLVVAAHPDDVEWYAGGLMALLCDGSSQVHLLVATDGEAGLGRARRPVARLRREEQLEAARRLGYASVGFLDLGDCQLLWRRQALRAAVERQTDELRPDLVVTFEACCPKLPYAHPDHIAVGRVVWHLCKAMGDRRPEICLFSSDRPNLVLDVSAVMDRKIDALGAHRSQGYRPGGHSYVVTMARVNGKAVGVPFAEAYRRLPAGRLAAGAAASAVAGGVTGGSTES